MNAHPEVRVEPPRGYLSEEAKRTFTMTAGILGAVFFVAQFVVPFVFMMALMPGMATFGGMDLRHAEVERCAFWAGRVWFVEGLEGIGPRARSPAVLRSFVPGSDEKPDEIATSGLEDPWPVAGKDRLWLVSSEGVGFVRDGEVTVLTPRESLADTTRPFLYGGAPAVVEERPAGQGLKVLVDGEWEERASFRLAGKDDVGGLEYRLQVVSTPGGLFFFLRHGDTIHYRKGIPHEGEDVSRAWETVSKVGHRWAAVRLGTEPAVFLRCGEGFDGSIRGLRREGGSWRPFFTHKRVTMSDFGICPLDEPGLQSDPGAFVVLTTLFPGSLKAALVRSGEVVSEARYGSGFPFPAPFMAMMFIPHAINLALPLVLAFVLSGLMRKHRACEYAAADGRAPLASLWRRALAQIVDAAFLALPVVAAVFSMMRSFMDPDEMFTSGYMLLGFGLVLGGLGWALAWVFIFSFLEGRWGKTPGKWLVGIQVLGVDLRPCGFGRALVRNLLKFVDGFFNFMVGILLVALTENWQRLGDLAARTVVVRVPSGHVSVPGGTTGPGLEI